MTGISGYYAFLAMQLSMARYEFSGAGPRLSRFPLDLSDMEIEAPETVAARIRRVLPHVCAEQIVVARDCGSRSL